MAFSLPLSPVGECGLINKSLILHKFPCPTSVLKTGIGRFGVEAKFGFFNKPDEKERKNL
jgi:hypothetical protein